MSLLKIVLIAVIVFILNAWYFLSRVNERGVETRKIELSLPSFSVKATDESENSLLRSWESQDRNTLLNKSSSEECSGVCIESTQFSFH